MTKHYDPIMLGEYLNHEFLQPYGIIRPLNEEDKLVSDYVEAAKDEGRVAEIKEWSALDAEDWE